MVKKLIIIGGVAGGASAAARARRLSEECEILIVEKGSYVSFANCGLPYHIGGEIPQREKLLVHTPQSLKQRFGIKVLLDAEVTRILRSERKIEIRHADGSMESQDYDKLIISTGAAPIRPPLPGINGRGVFTLRDISDMDEIISYLGAGAIQKTVVVGGGYIGVEVAEQLARLKTEVTLVEGKEQLLAPLDPEVAGIVEAEMRKHLNVVLGSRLKAIRLDNQGQAAGIELENGASIDGQLVILGLGVKPESALASNAGLETGSSGGIKVNEYLQTSDPDIYAVGDAIQVRNLVTQEDAIIALAGPANRQGRMAADNIFLERKKRYEGSLGTAVVRAFSLTAACTGANEKTLKTAGIRYEKLYLFPKSHAGYFPGAKDISLKILYSAEDRRLLGAQAVAEEGADKRIDVFATAIKGGLSIDQIAELELCYAPPVGSAKDPVNMAGMMMQNVADGLVTNVSPDGLSGFILDVREPGELKQGIIPGSVNIPLSELDQRIKELPRNQRINVYCQSGQRSYNVVRKLLQLGFEAVNVSGAFKAYTLLSNAHSVT